MVSQHNVGGAPMLVRIATVLLLCLAAGAFNPSPAAAPRPAFPAGRSEPSPSPRERHTEAHEPLQSFESPAGCALTMRAPTHVCAAHACTPRALPASSCEWRRPSGTKCSVSDVWYLALEEIRR